MNQIIQLDREELAAVVQAEVEKVLERHQSADRGFLRMREAAEFLGLTEAALRIAEKKGQLPSHRLGKRVLFDPAELRDFVLSGAGA